MDSVDAKLGIRYPYILVEAALSLELVPLQSRELGAQASR